MTKCRLTCQDRGRLKALPSARSNFGAPPKPWELRRTACWGSAAGNHPHLGDSNSESFPDSMQRLLQPSQANWCSQQKLEAQLSP